MNQASAVTGRELDRPFDWSLFFVVVVASQGLAAFLPVETLLVSVGVSAVIMAFSIIPSANRAASVLFSNPLLLLLVAWSVAAALLSPRPLVATSLAGVGALTILFLSLRPSTAGSVRTFAIGTTLSLVPSLIGRVAPVFPVLKATGSSAGYAGYFPWNSSAGLCAAAALVSVALTYFLSGREWWQLPSLGAAMAILIFSKSVTAFMALGAAAAVLGFRLAVNRVSPRLKPLLFVAASIAAVLLVPLVPGYALSVTTLANATDRTSSLSGRTQIWQWALEGVSESPYWGYGSEFWRSFGAWNRSGHNGFIDLALSAGVPALLAMCGIVTIAVFRLVRKSSILLPLLIFGVVANLTLSQLILPATSSIAMWLAIGATTRIGRDLVPNGLTPNGLTTAAPSLTNIGGSHKFP